MKLDQPWEGFLKTRSRLVHLQSKDRSEREFVLDSQDYANLVLGDLRVMVRIFPYRRAKVVKLDPKYRGSMTDLFFIGYHERLGLLLAGFLASFIGVFVLIMAFNYRASRPSKFADLEKNYTLPFINSNSLKTAPEALGKKIDREHLVLSVSRYYQAISDLVMGRPLSNGSFIYQTTQELYEKLHMTTKQRIGDLISRKHKKNSIQGEMTHTATLSIPSIHDSSFQTKLLRLIRKIDSLHESFELSLKLRRIINRRYRADPEYDWAKYVGIGETSEPGITGNNAEESGTKISVFDQTTDEEAMYLKAKQLGEKARALTAYLKSRSEPKRKLDESTVSDIYILPDVDFVSFLHEIENPSSNDPLNLSIEGLELEQEKPKAPREPLIGKISRQKLAAAIKRNRFHLNLCYELALRRNRNLRGQMDWAWRINSLGDVQDVSLDNSNLHDRQMISCIAGKIASWAFPHPKRGSIRVKHTFEFQPQDG